MNWSTSCAYCYGGRMFSDLATPKTDLGQYGAARNFALYVERMLHSDPPQPHSALTV